MYNQFSQSIDIADDKNHKEVTDVKNSVLVILT